MRFTDNDSLCMLRTGYVFTLRYAISVSPIFLVNLTILLQPICLQGQCPVLGGNIELSRQYHNSVLALSLLM